MPRRSRRRSNDSTLSPEIRRLVESEISRALTQGRPIAQGKLDLPAKPIPGAGTMANLLTQMQMQEAPAKEGPIMYPPGSPVQPTPGLVNPFGPRQWQYPIGTNIELAPRSTESMTFDTLRNLAALYDGIMLCEQVWLDIVSKLTLVVKPRNELVTAKADTGDQKLKDDIQRYTDFFSYPDRVNGLDLKSWMRQALRDQLQIDAVAIYPRKDRAGGLFSLELVDGTTIKPLLDPRGRRPEPPYPAYQQFLYGVPAGLYTADELLYIRETPRSDSPYGLSRVERIILRINQALRKQNKDLARFTEGNIPPGILEPPAESGEQWTPEQLAAYQTMWDAMLAGNDQLRSRVKVVAPGSKYTPIVDQDIFVDFDRFLMNITTACYSMTMADLGFTETVNKSSGDSQENVFYRRAVQPIIDRYAVLFTQVLKNYFNDDRFIVTWSGFEEAEDFASQATAYVALVGAGIISPSVAARLLKLPVEKDIPPYVIVPGQGITFLEDAADPEMRGAANDAKKAGYELAANPPPPPMPGDDEEDQGEPNGVGASKDDEEKTPGSDAKAPGSDEKPQAPPESGANKEESRPGKDNKEKPGVQRSVDSEVHNTGIMVAFMVKPEIAEQLALLGGESPDQLHVTLAYLGRVDDTPSQGKLSPVATPDLIRLVIGAFAQSAKPLTGIIGGIGRFAASPQSDGLSPIYVSPSVPGLQDFRRRLVDTLETAGYDIAKTWDYTPHCTLAYIDADAPMPIQSAPSLPLVFDELCLVIGDNQYLFPLGKVANEY
jgi:2'-5' RNA ligase